MPKSSKKNPARPSAHVLSDIGKNLQKLDAETDPSPTEYKELLEALQTEASRGMTIALLKQTQIGVTLGKTVKSLRRYKRSSPPEQSQEWSTLLETSQQLLSSWKEVAKQESSSQGKQDDDEEEGDDADTAQTEGLPTSVAAYRTRLTRQSKDLFKDPPVLPPPSITIEESTYSLPKRDKATGQLTFQAGQDAELKKVLRDFHPNRSPEEVLRAGSFGGTYFRPIVSAVTNVRYNAKAVMQDTLEPAWIQGLDKKTMLTSTTYRPQVNKYGVKCGGSLGMWESSGWITDSDPYGWFQWYCRFYRGRRCSDDARQISRWLKSAGPKGRFRSQLCNKIINANTNYDDANVSPVIRQTLLHWGLEITPQVLEQHKKRIK